MFNREHHVRVATILQVLNAELLQEKGCFFGGGTAIALSHKEYRESIDIDFLVSNLEGYRDLRQALKSASDLSPLLRTGQQLLLARDIRADQYGIRTMVNQGGVEIKFEIIFEGRILFDLPGPNDKICGVVTLSEKDMAASKLLANSDRWTDDSVFSRDLIDLAMLNLSANVRDEAIQKAEAAYGESVKDDLSKSIETLKNRPGRLKTCMSALKINALPEALLWQNIRALKPN